MVAKANPIKRTTKKKVSLTMAHSLEKSGSALWFISASAKKERTRLMKVITPTVTVIRLSLFT